MWVADPSQLLYREVAGAASAVQLHFEMSMNRTSIMLLRAGSDQAFLESRTSSSYLTCYMSTK